MRVGFDARWNNDSGVGVYVCELLRAMAVAERDCDLIVYEDPGNPIPQLEGERVTRIPVQTAKYSLAAQFDFRHRAERDQLDVFHSPFYAAPLGLKCPTVVTVHDLIPFLLPVYSWPKQTIVRMGYRAAVRRAARIIADSATTARDLQRVLSAGEQKIATIHIAASREFSAMPLSRDELQWLQQRFGWSPPYVVVASARNWRSKNLRGALQSLQIAARSGVKFQTVVYGPPDGLDALGGEQSWPGLDLQRAGYLQRGDLAALFRHAHAFLMPSFYEGFGLPILEAMACSCPVVASNAGSLPEVAGNGAQVFAPDDHEGMAAAVARLLVDQDERRRWRRNALARARDFSWSRAAVETISVYDRIHKQAVAARAS